MHWRHHLSNSRQLTSDKMKKFILSLLFYSFSRRLEVINCYSQESPPPCYEIFSQNYKSLPINGCYCKNGTHSSNSWSKVLYPIYYKTENPKVMLQLENIENGGWSIHGFNPSNIKYRQQ